MVSAGDASIVGLVVLGHDDVISTGNGHAKCETFRSLGTRPNSVISQFDRLYAVSHGKGENAPHGALLFRRRANGIKRSTTIRTPHPEGKLESPAGRTLRVHSRRPPSGGRPRLRRRLPLAQLRAGLRLRRGRRFGGLGGRRRGRRRRGGRLAGGRARAPRLRRVPGRASSATDTGLTGRRLPGFGRARAPTLCPRGRRRRPARRALAASLRSPLAFPRRRLAPSSEPPNHPGRMPATADPPSGASPPFWPAECDGLPGVSAVLAHAHAAGGGGDGHDRGGQTDGYVQGAHGQPPPEGSRRGVRPCPTPAAHKRTRAPSTASARPAPGLRGPVSRSRARAAARRRSRSGGRSRARPSPRSRRPRPPGSRTSAASAPGRS